MKYEIESRFPTTSLVWILWGVPGGVLHSVCHAHEMWPLLLRGHVRAAVQAESVTQGLEER